MSARPSLRGTKSNFTLAANINSMNSINDERVKQFLRTELIVRKWINESLNVNLGNDLYEQLRSGVVLCYLANAISPDAVPKIQENTNVEFKLSENISFFFLALDEFDIPKHKRFQLADLYEGGNKVRVIECLVSLAEYAVAKLDYKIKLKPIDPKTPVVVPASEQLKELKYFLSLIKEPTKQVKGGRKGATILKTQMALLAGNTVDFAKCERGFIAFQSLWRGFRARKFLTKIKRDCAYRDKITQEIYKTEKDYVTNLNICIQHYMVPLKELLNKEQIKTIFSDIQIIHAFGQKLIEKLRPRIESWNHRQKLGDIFLEIADFLKVYTGYIQNYNNSLTLLEEIRKKDKLNTALTECRNNPECKGFDLTSFLITPIQRVPRYNLLLLDLVKHTWPEHPDYKSLCDATDRIKGIASFLNEKKREGENLKRFTDIQACLEKGPLLFAPTRKFIKQGCFFISKKDEVSIFLFNDILVYGKPTTRLKSTSTTTKERKVKYRGTMDLLTVEVIATAQLGITLKSSEVSLSFTAKDENECEEWLEDLNKTIIEAKEKDNLVKEAKAGISAKESTPAPVQPEKVATVDQQLAERRKTTTKKPADLAASTGGSSSPATTPSPAPISLSTSVSLPSSPVTSPTKDVASPTPSSPQMSGNSGATREGHGFSFITSILGKSSGSNDRRRTLKDEHLGSGSNSNSSEQATETTETNKEGTTDSGNSEPSSPNSKDISNKTARPKKKKQHSVDDIEIGVKKSSNEDGGRARAQSRLQKLTGTLTFRKKRDKDKLDAAAASATPPNEPNDNNSNEENNSVNDNNSTTGNETTTTATPTLTTSTTTTSTTTTTSDNVANVGVVTDSINTLTVSSGGAHQQHRKTPPPPIPNRNFSAGETVGSLTSSGGNNSPNNRPSDQHAEFIANTTKFTFEEIKNNRAELDQSKLETYLREDEFARIFNMEPSAFYKLPKWKQDQKKRDLKLL